MSKSKPEEKKTLEEQEVQADLEKDLEAFIERKNHEKKALIKLLQFVEVKRNKQK